MSSQGRCHHRCQVRQLPVPLTLERCASTIHSWCDARRYAASRADSQSTLQERALLDEHAQVASVCGGAVVDADSAQIVARHAQQLASLEVILAEEKVRQREVQTHGPAHVLNGLM